MVRLVFSMLVLLVATNQTMKNSRAGGGELDLWLTATKLFISEGESTILVVGAPGADHFTVTPDGTTYDIAHDFVLLSPTVTTEYVVEAFSGTDSITETITITVAPIRVVSFTSDPSILEGPGTTRLSWVVRTEGDVRIDGIGIVPLEGSTIVPVNESKAFTMRASSGGFETTATAEVLLLSEPMGSIVLSWSPDSIPGEPPNFYPYDLDFYVHLFGVEQFSGYEFAVRMPWCTYVYQYTLNPGQVITNAPEYQNFDVSIGDCASGPSALIVAGEGGVPEEFCTAEGLLVTLEPAEFSSFDPPAPGYVDCDGNRHPLHLGPPLYYITNTPVPVTSFSLHALAHSNGTELTWNSPPGVHPSDITILRGRNEDTLEPVITLPGEPGAGVWVDARPLPGAVKYQLLVHVNGIEWSSEIVEFRAAGNAPTRSKLLANHPNPFNPTTQIRFTLAEAGDVRIRVVDPAGRVVRTFELAHRPVGEQWVEWNGKDERDQRVASGTYLVELEAGGTRDARRVTLLK